MDAAASGIQAETSEHPAVPLDRPQLDAAYRREAGELLRYLRRKAGPDHAPDLLQEVFARTAARCRLIVLQNPAAYLQRVARNILIEHMRFQAREGAVLLPLDAGRDAACEPAQIQTIEAQDLLKTYEKAVSTMSEKTRRVFLMHRVDEMSYREIHEELGIGISTVEYHMTKALAHLAKQLDVKR